MTKNIKKEKKIPSTKHIQNGVVVDNGKGFVYNYRHIITILIIGTLLRFVTLGNNSIWLDEASTYLFAKMPPIEIWEATAGGEFNPPLFYILEHFMLNFGTNEFVLRFLPALFGVITIFVFYLIGKEIKDEKLGLLSAFIITILPFHIIYSQEARAYTLGLLFTSLVILCFIKEIKDDQSYKYWILTPIFASLAFWSHFYTVLITLPIMLFVVFYETNKFKKSLISLLTFVIVSSPLIYVMKDLLIMRTASAPTYGLKGIDIITSTIFSMWMNSIADIIFIILFIIGIFTLYKYNQYLQRAFLFSIFVLCVGSVTLSYTIPILPRYLIVILPLIIIPIAYFINGLKDARVSSVIIFLFVIVSAASLYPIYTTQTHDDWRSITTELQKMTQDGDVVMVIPAYNNQPIDFYYSNTTDLTIKYGVSTIDDITQLTKPHNTYYILSPDVFAISDGQKIVNWINENLKNGYIKPMYSNNNLAIFKNV